MSNELTGMAKVKQARARLWLNQPFWGSCSTALSPRVDNGCQTAYTDGKVMGFNEAYINSLSINHVETVVAHEALHCILLHMARIAGRDGRLANVAMDYVINGILKRAGFPIKEGWLLHPEYSNGSMSWETVYSKLKKENGEGDGKGDGKGKGNDDGRKKGNDDGSGGNGRDGGNGNNSSDDADGNDTGKPGSGDAEWNLGEVREAKNADGKSMSESERSSLEYEWKITANKAAQAARACGKLPAGMERIIEDINVTKKDVEECLRDFVSKVFGGDYSYAKPNKTYIIRDLYLPTMQCDQIPDIVMVLDTSGSISQKQVNYFAAKLNSVLHEYKTTVHVCYCDTKVYDGGEYSQDDLPVRLTAKGGGGTDFVPPFKWVDGQELEPACLIYLTDLECSSFPAEPDYPVLWCVYNEYNRGSRGEYKVPFGEVIDIDPGKE